jgi:hypothetical protein
MEINTFGDLIGWTSQLHEQLGQCLAQGASRHEDERARMLLDYLATHETEMAHVVKEFERRADPKALNTYVAYLYEALAQQPIQPHRYSDASFYSALSFDDICREVFDFHDQVVDLYRRLNDEAVIPEASELLESLLEYEHNEAMRLVRQTERMQDL